MNSEHLVYILFLIIYLIIFYLYYDEYCISSNETNVIIPITKKNINETFIDTSPDLTSQVQAQYYNDLAAIQNILKVAYMINSTNSITISGDLSISGTQNLLPPGIVTAYVGTTSPYGWLICDGSPVSKITYPRLFSIIGNTFNNTKTGSSSLNNPNYFNLPDYRDVFLRGCGAPGINSPNYSLPSNNIKYMSTRLNTLQTSQLQDHTHDVIDPGHSHEYDAYFNNINNDRKINFDRENNNNYLFGGSKSWGWNLRGKNTVFNLANREPVTITNIKISNSDNGIDSSNILDTDIYPCNVTINWIIKY